MHPGNLKNTKKIKRPQNLRASSLEPTKKNGVFQGSIEPPGFNTFWFVMVKIRSNNFF